MLKSMDGKEVKVVPHRREFDAVLRRLGEGRVTEVRDGLNDLIDGLPTAPETGRRVFSSSVLGSRLTPWPYPIRHLRDVAQELEGEGAAEEAVEERAALLFGLFIWECVIDRDEGWVFYDPNLSARDPNREVTGKVYFEQ